MTKLIDSRKDFPLLSNEFNGKPWTYLDNAAMSLKPRQVVEAMQDYYYNFSSVTGRSMHHLASETQMKCSEAREKVAKFLNAGLNEVVFTRNATESLNLLSHSLKLKSGDKVLTSDREHNSNLIPWLMLREKGVRHAVVPSNEDSTFDLNAFQESLSKDVKLVSIVHASNLDGYVLPLKEIVKMTHDVGALIAVDAAQSAPHSKLDVKQLDVDFLALSSHKMLGPTGMGVLFSKSDLLNDLNPFLTGGSTVSDSTYDSYEFLKGPERFEAGLQDFAGIIGTGAAVDYVSRIGFDDIQSNDLRLNSFVSKQLGDMSNISILGPSDPSLRSSVVSFTVKGVDPHDVALVLDESSNICVRSGMHCCHSWFNAHSIGGSVRASFYFYNTLDEAKLFTEALKNVVETLSY
ncbi:MAG: aminotransferase class V-fold PLP-dependent enzyme, partial [Candidatus Diapherotrites archaeon]|nr:aminotransferase class V-fold PLP-dependent enzyme [Candidatus Diapherotrites archaeon]